MLDKKTNKSNLLEAEMKTSFYIVLIIAILVVISGCLDLTNTNNDQEYNQLPKEADLNGDGILSPEEVAVWNANHTE